MKVNNYEVTVYGDHEVAVQTNPKQLEATGGVVYLTESELCTMLNMLKTERDLKAVDAVRKQAIFEYAQDHATLTDADLELDGDAPPDTDTPVERLEVDDLEAFDNEILEAPPVAAGVICTCPAVFCPAHGRLNRSELKKGRKVRE